MIFNVGGGGGAALNFRVVGGTTAPSNPAENCIWVDTDTPITSYVFSATEPSPAEAGKVWITTGTYSPVAFNALKKNGIQVYPISAKQYIGGAWVEKTARSYQGGDWIEWWNGELYDTGNEYGFITGGWEASDTFYVTTGTRRPDLVEKTAECIHLKSGAQTSVVAVTKNKIDLSEYTTLCFDVEVTDGGGGSDCYGIISGPGDVYTYPTAKVETSAGGRNTLRLDISTRNDAFYVFVGAGSRDRKIYRVRMEGDGINEILY